MISNNINRNTGAFKEVAPDAEGLKNSQEFFVMRVVVEFGSGKGAGVESHRVDFTGVGLNRENCSQSIVGGIGLENNWFLSGIQCVRIGAEVNADLRFSKAVLAESEKFHFIPLRVRQVSGMTISE